MRLLLVLLLTAATLFADHASVQADDGATYTRQEDVIYGRKHGVVLTMDVFRPKNDANGAGVLIAVSGGWVSRHENINPLFCAELLRRGYTVFAVVHGSQPKYTIPEIVEDMHRAVRFVRTRAADFGIDGNRLGITGASAGGHLSLMIGTAGQPGNPKAADPVERASSRVQAVACFFPPTDFLNFGVKGKELLGPEKHRPPFRAPFDFRELDPEKRLFLPVTDEAKLREITRQISPITHVTPDDAPTLLIHGDKDDLVPLQQSEIMLAKFKEAGVPAELVVRKGAGHGWLTMLTHDLPVIADWFDKYLKQGVASK